MGSNPDNPTRFGRCTDTGISGYEDERSEYFKGEPLEEYKNRFLNPLTVEDKNDEDEGRRIARNTRRFDSFMSKSGVEV